MKKTIFLIFTCALTLMNSCNNNEKEVKDLINNFAAAVQNGNKSEIKNIYPLVQDGDSIMISAIPLDSMEISSVDDSTFLVKMGNSKDMTIARSSDGKMTIKKSHGLFWYESSQMEWAKKVGQFKTELDDVTNAAHMRDDRFMNEIKQKIIDQVKSGLKAQCINSGFRESDFSVGYSVKVTNNNDFEIPGDMYEVKATLMGFDTERLVDVVAQRKTLTGKSIPAGGSVTYSLGRTDAEYGSWRAGSVTVTDVPAEVLMKLYTPRGNEYDEFIKEHGEPELPSQPTTTVDSNSPLKLNMNGIMGGCGTKLTFDTEEGTLDYNPHGNSLNGNLQHRTASLVSYDPNSGDLVIEIKNGGKKTGNLDGKLKDGTYSGRFKNVNGHSSSFSFK